MNLATWDAVCINLPSPDGTLNVVFSEDRITGKPIRVEVFIGKAGSTLRAWATSFAEIMTKGLEKGVEIDDYYNVLVSQTSDKRVMLKPGFYVQSGPEAIAVAILKYKKYKYEQLSKELSLEDDDEPREPHGYFTNPGRDLDK